MLKKIFKDPLFYVSMVVFIAALFLLWAFPASAASITVYPTITNAHGGNAIARDMGVCITIDGARQCVSDNAVPVFEVASSSAYEVGVVPVPGYSYALGNNCSGIAIGTTSVTCSVDYQDGAPIPKPAPAPVLTPVSAPTIMLPASVVPDIVAGGAGVPVGDVATSSASADVAAQIASLQAQIIELYKILIALLAQKLAVIQ